MGKLKILIPVDPEIPVPPPQYGGVERLVDGLITEYTKLGHEVILLAHPDSTAEDATRRYKWPETATRGKMNILRNAIKLYKVSRKERPDIIHSFSRLLYMYPSMLVLGIPVVMTYGRFISPRSTALASLLGGKKMHFTTAAGHMQNHLKRYKEKFTTIYNFTPVDYFFPDPNVEREYFMFLGRIEDIKGTKECIDVALQTKTKLIIAGNIQAGHDDYFEESIRPHLDNPLIEYVGQVNDEQKRHYLQRSKALLFPIKWEEPFGIVMAEAMSCGTPVLAFNRGSVPEVIKEGLNGHYCSNVDEMIQLVEKLKDLNPEEIRQDAVHRFSPEMAGRKYMEVLQKTIHNTGRNA